MQRIIFFLCGRTRDFKVYSGVRTGFLLISTEMERCLFLSSWLVDGVYEKWYEARYCVKTSLYFRDSSLEIGKGAGRAVVLKRKNKGHSLT